MEERPDAGDSAAADDSVGERIRWIGSHGERGEAVGVMGGGLREDAILDEDVADTTWSAQGAGNSDEHGKTFATCFGAEADNFKIEELHIVAEDVHCSDHTLSAAAPLGGGITINGAQNPIHASPIKSAADSGYAQGHGGKTIL